jgi:ribulose bisphosphate carboxylase small subunit
MDDGLASKVTNQLDPQINDQVTEIIKGGFDITIEYVDRRRFSTNAWQIYGVIKHNQPTQGISLLQSCLDEYPNHYIRLVTHLPQQQTRHQEIIIQRP